MFRFQKIAESLVSVPSISLVFKQAKCGHSPNPQVIDYRRIRQMKKSLALAAFLSVSTAILGAATLLREVPSEQLGTSGTITVGTEARSLAVVPLPIPDPASPNPPASTLTSPVSLAAMPLPIPDPSSPNPPASMLTSPVFVAVTPLPIPNPSSPNPPASMLTSPVFVAVTPLPIPDPSSPNPPAVC